ncbi:MAG: pyridoxamine 5'-phosphate oxidase family protein [Chloroflexi bacterium]|nr:pyridoxamine 5'-phosphate oxidase family protein [Chloroflexota bacterium]MCC6895104.1 pyridoxamine 5'-phosphate oxidase family protein [Anaerolineae bacterium]
MNSTRQEKIEKLRELIKDIDFAMFTTVSSDGTLHSRPMSTQQTEFDGDIWFFTSLDTQKAADIKEDQTVNVAYAAPDQQRYISVSGKARLVNDKAKMKELWSPVYKIWFKDGLDDPQLRLIKVSVNTAEYWDSPHGIINKIIGFADAIIHKDAGKMGENETITLKK